MLYSIVAVLVIILDQAVKNWVSNTLFGTDIVKFIPGVLSLVNVHNDGAAFSFLSGSGARIYFIIVTGIFTVAVIVALVTNFISGRLSRWSIVLVTAGGLSNCLDRIIYGYVQDMFKVEIFDFAIFNVADVFITVFAIVFAIAMIFERQEDTDEDEYYDEEEEQRQEEKKRAKKKDRAVKAERKPLLDRFKKDSSLDEDEEEEQPRPARREGRTQKRVKFEDEYEQYKAQREARQAAQRPQPKPDPSYNAADPFAEWEKANANADAQRGGSYAAKAMGTAAPGYVKPAQPAPQQPRQAAYPAPAQPRQPAPQQQPRQAAYSPAPQPPQPARGPAQPGQPAAKPAAKSGSDFDLDDILAEFK